MRIFISSVVGQVLVGHDGEYDQDQSEARGRKQPHDLEPGSEPKLPHLLQILAVLSDAVEVGDGDHLEQADEEESSRGGVVVENLRIKMNMNLRIKMNIIMIRKKFIFVLFF